MVGVSGVDSCSISHSCAHDWQTSVTLTKGRPGTVSTFRATPTPVPHAGHWRRTDMGVWERGNCSTVSSAVVTPDNHVRLNCCRACFDPTLQPGARHFFANEQQSIGLFNARAE